MARTVIDILEAHFGEPFGPDLIVLAQRATLEDLRALQGSVRSFTENVELESRPVGHLRPYVPTERDPSTMHEWILPLRPADFRDLNMVERGFGSLKHHLLYCHSLAFDDPLPWILDILVGDLRGSMLEEAQHKIVNCLQFLSWIRQLIDCGVVVLVENGLRGWPLPALSNPDRLAESLDFSDLPEELTELLHRNGTLAKQSFLSIANEQLSWSLDATKRNPDALDLYLPFRHYEGLLREVLNQAGRRSDPRADAVGQLRILQNLLQVDVPTLGELEISDLVAIRQSDTAFEQWRTALEVGLKQTSALDPDMLGIEHEAIRVIHQQLQQERRKLEASIDQSRFLSHAKRSRKQLAVGAVSAPFDGGGAVAQAGFGAVLDYFGGRRDRDRATSTLRHYLLFAPTPP